MSDELPESDRVPGHPHPRETARLFGQARAERAFLEAWGGGRIHHAWLLRGPAGVGKATLAYRMARALIAGGPLPDRSSPPPGTLDAPAGCPVARRILAGSEPALRVLRREVNEKSQAKTPSLYTRIRIDDVRQVKRFLQYAATDGGWRAVIVDSADEMTVDAANALLKFLEEPPERTALMLVAHSPARLLPTIRSRCRTLDLSALGPEDLARALAQAGAEAAPEDAAALAALGGGSVGAALRLAAEEGPALYRRICSAIGEARVDRPAMLGLAQGCVGKGAEARYALTLDLVAVLVARLAKAAAGHPPEPLLPPERRLVERVGRTPAQARIWAEAAARLASAAAHARAVNLDPAQTVIDTFLDLDDRLRDAERAA